MIFGFTALKQCFSFSKSVDMVEYGTEIGAAGAPIFCAARITMAERIELPDRIITGASGPAPRSRKACARPSVTRLASP